jgi:hypothetical protein
MRATLGNASFDVVASIVQHSLAAAAAAVFARRLQCVRTNVLYQVVRRLQSMHGQPGSAALHAPRVPDAAG